MEDNAAADAAARELRVDFARTSRGLTTGQDDESPPTSLVSEVSARSRRSTALFSTTDLVQVVIDLLPGIALIVPPCVPVNQRTLVEVHIDPSDVQPDKLELVAMAGGVCILKQKLTEATRVVSRVEVIPFNVGTVDFFIRGKDDKNRAAAGIPGHLSVLPPLAARDASMIYERLVEVAEREQRLLVEAKAPAAECSEDRAKIKTVSVSVPIEHKRESDPPENIAGYSKIGHEPDPAMLYSSQPHLAEHRFSDSCDSRGPSDPLVVSYAYLQNWDQDIFINMLAMQKSVWKTKFLPFVLELEVVLQSLKPTPNKSCQQANSVGATSQSGATGLELGPTFLLVLENMLRNLCVFETWELISLILSRTVEGGIGVFWGNERLPYESLTADNLKERAQQQPGPELEVVEEDLLEIPHSVDGSVGSFYFSVDSWSSSKFEELKNQGETSLGASGQVQDEELLTASGQQHDTEWGATLDKKEVNDQFSEGQQHVGQELVVQVVDGAMGKRNAEKIEFDEDVENAQVGEHSQTGDTGAVVDEAEIPNVEMQHNLKEDPAGVVKNLDDSPTPVDFCRTSSVKQQVNVKNVSSPAYDVSNEQHEPMIRRLLHKVSRSLSRRSSRSGDMQFSKGNVETSEALLHSMPEIVAPSQSNAGIVRQGDSPSSFRDQTIISTAATNAATHPLFPVEERQLNRKGIGKMWKAVRKGLLRMNTTSSEKHTSALGSQSEQQGLRRVTKGFHTETRPVVMEKEKPHLLQNSAKS